MKDETIVQRAKELKELNPDKLTDRGKMIIAQALNIEKLKKNPDNEKVQKQYDILKTKLI